MVRGSQAAAFFCQKGIYRVNGEAAMFILVDGMKDAVIRFESPGVKFVSHGCNLQSTFSIPEAKNAGSVAMVPRSVFNSSVQHFSTGTVFIVIFNGHEPLTRNLCGCRHKWQDQFGIGNNILHFARVNPDAEDTAGANTFLQTAAFERL